MQIDAPSIETDQASYLLWYHLRMAAALFEILPGDIKVHKANMTVCNFFSDEAFDPVIESGAMIAFIDALQIWNEELEE